MGAVIRIVFFFIGLAVLLLTGLVAAQGFGVDTNALLMAAGEAPGNMAIGLQDRWGGLLEHGGARLGEGAVATYGPLGIAALLSLILLFLALRR